MNSIDFDFDDDDYDDVLSNNGLDDHAWVNIAQVEDLEGHLDFNDPEEMFSFAIHDMDSSDINLDYLCCLKNEIYAIATDFWSNQSSFDKTQAYLIYGQTGHDFNNCLYLRDSEKIKHAYIRLRMAIGKFLNFFKKINGPTQELIQLALMDIHVLECAGVFNSITTVSTFPSSSKPSQDDILNKEFSALVGSKFEFVGKKLGATNNTVNKMLHRMDTHLPKDDDDDKSIDSLDSLNILSSLLSSSGKESDFSFGQDKY